MNTREPAVIAKVFAGKEPDHQIETVIVSMEGPTGGWGQGFGCLALTPEARADFVRELCALFRVSDAKQLVGRRCDVLRCFDGLNEPIEGLEVDGRRFTLSRFIAKHWPEKAETRLQRARNAEYSEIAWARRRIQEAEKRLRDIDARYVDWEKKP